MSETGKIIAQRLATMRRRHGWTLQETANEMELSGFSRYSNWEMGLRIPKYDDLRKAAKVFGVSPAWLAGFSDYEDGTDGTPTGYVQPAKPVPEVSNASDFAALHADYLEARGIPQDKTTFVICDDDAMAGMVEKGDRVLVDMARNKPEARDLYAFAVEGRAWIRWIRPELDGSFTVTAENAEQYPPQTLTKEQLSGLKIIGRVADIYHSR